MDGAQKLSCTRFAGQCPQAVVRKDFGKFGEIEKLQFHLDKACVPSWFEVSRCRVSDGEPFLFFARYPILCCPRPHLGNAPHRWGDAAYNTLRCILCGSRCALGRTQCGLVLNLRKETGTSELGPDVEGLDREEVREGSIAPVSDLGGLGAR